MRAPITGVLFDHDGTLVNSLPAVVEATNRALAGLGYGLQPAEAIIAGMAMPTVPRMAHHAGITDQELMRQLAQSFKREVRGLGAGWSTLYPGILSLVSDLSGRGIPLGMISNNDGDFIRMVMGELGLTAHFTAIYAEEDMPAPKPDPRGLLSAARDLGQEPKRCIYIGDSHCDVLGAHAAGMRAVGVTWGIHRRRELDRMGFDWLIDHPRQLLSLLQA